MLRFPFRLTVVAAALAAAAPSHAEAPKSADKAEPPVQKVEVKGSAESYNPRRDDTATKIVVNHDEIVKYGDTNVLDVLKRVPGITVAASGGRGGEIRMRGLGSGYTQILIDGEKAPAGFSIESLAPDTIERIEVMRAATAEFSTQSIAGTINIVLRKAIRNAQRELKIRTGWSRTSKPRPGMNLQMSDRAGSLAWSLGFNADSMHFERDGLSLAENHDTAGAVIGETMVVDKGQTNFHSYSLMPRLTWNFANGDTLTSQSSFNFSRFRSMYEQDTRTLQGAGPDYGYIDTASQSRSRALRTELNWVHKPGAGAKLDLKLSGTASRGDSGGKRFGYAQQYGQPMLERDDGGASRDTAYATIGKYSAPIGDGHSLMAGWDLSVATRDTLATVDQHSFPLDLPRMTRDEFEAQVRRMAAFAQDEWKVSEQWSVYAGVRWEGSRTSVEGTGYAQSTSQTGVWSPVFQTLYKIPGRKGDQLRLALTRTYKAPFAGSLIPTRSLSLNNSRDEPDYAGNPGLKPEIALGLDASYEHYWSEGAMLSASVSMREIDGYTSLVNVLESNGRWLVMNRNNGKAHTRGIELEAKFPLKAIMANAPAVDLRANLSRNWSEVDALPGPYNRLARQTPMSGSAGADYKAGRLTAGASVSYQKGGTVQASDTERQVTPSYFSAEAYALWKFDPRSQLRFSVANLGQKDYVSQQLYADRLGTGRRTTYYPSSPSFRLALEFKL